MKETPLSSFVVLLFVFAGFCVEHCDCKIKEAKREKYDSALVLSDEAKDNSEKAHLPFGVPATPG